MSKIHDQLAALGYTPSAEFEGTPLVTDKAGKSLTVTKILDGFPIHVRKVSRQRGRESFHVSALICGLWQGLHWRPIPGLIAPDAFVRERLEFHKGVLREYEQ